MEAAALCLFNGKPGIELVNMPFELDSRRIYALQPSHNSTYSAHAQDSPRSALHVCVKGILC